ncbi:MAG: ribosome silencing factor [Ginsengibacter sp.]
MNNLDLLENRPKSKVSRLTRNSKLFKTAIHAIQEKMGEKIVSLDLKKIPEAVTDYFIICEASNPPQLKAIADSVEHEIKKLCGESPYKHEGRQGEQWILLDYVDMVVHVMLEEPRKFYKIEEMWSDASRVEH